MTNEIPSPPTVGLPPGLGLEGLQGLSEAEVLARRAAEGSNELRTTRERSLLALVLGVAREPMFMLLVAAGAVYLVVGELADALMLLFAVVAVMILTIVQERRTGRALDALRDLSSPRALVLRDGARRHVAGSELVRGDLVVLCEGDRVPADGLLRRGFHLSTDESLLTGESAPVRKTVAGEGATMGRPGGDDLPSLYAGTLITAGQGVVEIVSTGQRTEMGRLGDAIGHAPIPLTRLQAETARIVRILAAVALLSCALMVVVFGVSRGGGATAWKHGFLGGIAMAMALLPEELPVILTVSLALGAWRLSRQRVLARRLPAVEILGATTVLCVDKTGTLTENHMTLRHLALVDGADDGLDLAARSAPLPEAFHDLLEHAILASKRDPFDPMERALHEAGDGWIAGTEHLHPSWRLRKEYPLSPRLPAMSHAWSGEDGVAIILATKGAPETIAELCRLGEEGRARLMAQVQALASRGLRVLAVARGQAPEGELPDDQRHLPLTLVGLLGFEDPIRASVPAAIAACRLAGVRVVMITGDNPTTAACIARQAGLDRCDAIMTGGALAAATDAELQGQLGEIGVFARVLPEQKLRIVQAFRAAGEVVAMTGDGVNDAPALSAADVGVAMGGRGTDVAREAAALVLLDDDLSSLVLAITLGRRVFDNIRRAIVFTLAVHVPIAGLSLLPVFVSGWPLLMLPVHVAFLELVIDPSCSLVFEADEAADDIMRRPPRPQDERLFSRASVARALLQGLGVLLACGTTLLLARRGYGDDGTRALTFATLVAGVLALIFANRAHRETRPRHPNLALRWVLGGATSLLAMAVLLPAGQRLFHFAPVAPAHLLLASAAGGVSALWSRLLPR